MKPTQKMTADAEAAAQRYGTLVDAWRSLYQSAVNASDFGSLRQMTQLTDQAYAMGRTFVTTEGEIIDQAFDEIASEALTATHEQLSVTDTSDFTDAVYDHLSAAKSHLVHEITVQVERDINFLQQSLRKSWLQVSLSARSRGITQKAAQIEYTLGSSQELHFFFHDRGNQKWPSRKFIRAVWRHNLLAAYNEVVLLTLADHGIERAVIEHDNPQSAIQGLAIGMSANQDLPTYAEVRNDYFHPNADAILRAPDVPAQ